MNTTENAAEYSEKYAAEIQFWREEIDRYVTWWNGGMREFYGVLAPTPEQRVTRHATDRLNALETWVNADRWRYCKHLLIEPTYFDNQTVLEVGCGPLGLARWFVGAHVVGLDPLWREYFRVGYPINNAQEILCSKAEEIDIDDDAFDATFSVNAIDHVDDFAEAVSEIERVTRADGEIRIEVHYHKPTTTEPHSLNDETVRAAFSKFEMHKLAESPSTRFYPPGTHPRSDRFALWSNKRHLWEADVALR